MVATRRAFQAAEAKTKARSHHATPVKASPPSKRTTQKSSKDKQPTKPVAIQTDNDGNRLQLFSLTDGEELVRAKVVARPSKRNRSPYVADVWLEDEQREAIAHVPNLDMGGKCVPDAVLLLKPARDNKGNKVPATAVSPKYGTPKCEFITQLLYVDESKLSSELYPPTWVGAHPALGERIAESWLWNNLIPDIPPATDLQKQVRNPCGADMRPDFVLTHEDGTKRVVEVKTVVDTDYSDQAPPNASLKCRFLSDKQPYSRTAIFPWGNSNQKGPNGEKVVSARAIKHIQEMTSIATGQLTDCVEVYKATILFVVIRGDAEAFRPNADACPSFSKYLRAATDAGVQVLAKRVSWGTGANEGKCLDDKMLPIEWPGKNAK